jgi:predicted metal-binding protein
MANLSLKTITVNTPRHKLDVECYFDFVSASEISVQKELFSAMCKQGCSNFGKKYSCPPLSPDFNHYVKNNKLLVLLLKTDLSQLSAYKPYHRLRVANAVLKSRIEKIMRSLEENTDTKFLGTGACRLCKPCHRKKGLPCNHPDKMRYSLESLGVDCNKLAKDLFGIPLQWYKSKTCPEYTCVMCAIPLKNKTSEIINALVEQLAAIT